MKAMIALSVFSLFSLPTFANDLNGTLEGSCTIETATSTETLSFSVPNNKKAITYFTNATMVEVANNLGTSSVNEYGAAYISVSRTDGAFRNPPVLCPSWPLDAKEACERENAEQAEANRPVKAPVGSFELVKHNGRPNSVWIKFDNSGDIALTFARVELSTAKAEAGAGLIFPKYAFGEQTLSCTSKFVKN